MKIKDFEQALRRLEEIVGKLEAGEMPLEESLKLFEEGMQVSRYCANKLEEAERKVEVLLKQSDGQYKEETLQFDEQDDELN